MSRIRADRIVNRAANGPVEAAEGITIPSNKSIVVGTNSGSVGQYLGVTANGLSWSTPAGSVGSGGSYTLPIATASTLGGIKIGTGLSIDAGGVVTATGSGSGGIADILADTTPQLGGNLDTNAFDITGGISSTIELQGQSSKLRFHYDTFAGLPSASSWHGMFAHAHDTGRAYVAHDGTWEALAKLSDVSLAQVQSNWTATTGLGVILNKPTLATVATSGSYADLSNQPTLFSGSYTDLSNQPASYTLPTATDTVLGGIKIGSGLSITDGVVSGDVVLDTTPQLGGNLDINSRNITGTGNIDVAGDITGKGLKVSYNNPTSLTTPGTHGEIRKIDGAPFWYDGVEWREFFLIDATAVTTVPDTDWDRTFLRCDFNTDTTDQRFGAVPLINQASVSASQYKFGAKSLRITTATSYLTFSGQGATTGDRPEYDFEGEWTIEGWYYFNGISFSATNPGNAGRPILWNVTGAAGESIISLDFTSYQNSADGNYYILLTYNSENVPRFTYSDNADSIPSLDIKVNTWHHIAVQRAGNGLISIIVDGNRQGTYIDNSVINIVDERINIGQGFYVNSNYSGGFIDDFRISTIARYSSTDNSNPPTEALPISGSTTTIIPTNSSNTFGISAETATGTNATLRLRKSNSTNDDILLVGAGGLTISRTDDSTITFTGSISWSISASGSDDYVFSGPGIVSGNTNDPVLYLYRGFTYTFVNNVGGSHPFAIRVSNGGIDYTSGVSGSQTGTQTFVVPMNAPSTLYYQCTAHPGMGNVINII